jgi:hypothetical protein
MQQGWQVHAALRRCTRAHAHGHTHAHAPCTSGPRACPCRSRSGWCTARRTRAAPGRPRGCPARRGAGERPGPRAGSCTYSTGFYDISSILDWVLLGLRCTPRRQAVRELGIASCAVAPTHLRLARSRAAAAASHATVQAAAAAVEATRGATTAACRRQALPSGDGRRTAQRTVCRPTGRG